MIEVFDSDFVPLETFPLKWRWTDERWNLLPTEIIQQIEPLTAKKSKEIWKIQEKYLFH